MTLAKKIKGLSMAGVSVGGVTHNMGQLMIATGSRKSGKCLFYFPILLYAGHNWTF